MKSKLLVLILVISVVGGLWVVREREQNSEGRSGGEKSAQRVRSGADFPSREGKICGLMRLQDALDLTGEPFDALYESTLLDRFPETEKLIQQDLFVNCLLEISKYGYKSRKVFVVWASSQKKQARSSYVGYDEQFETGQRFAALGEQSARFTGPDYSGRVSAGHGGYLMHYCPGGGRFVVTVGHPTAMVLGDLALWQKALVNINDEIMRLGGCAEPDRLAAQPSLTAKPLPSATDPEHWRDTR